MTPPAKQSLRTWISRLIVGFAILFIIRMLAEGWPLVASQLTHPRWSFLASAWLLFVGYFLARAVAWWLLLRGLNTPLTLVTAGRIWFLSEFCRYIPGTIWSFVSRITLAESAKVPKRHTLVSLVLESALLVGSAAVFGAVFLWLAHSPSIGLSRWLALLALPVLVVCFSPHWLGKVINYGLQRIKRQPIQFILTTPQLGTIFLTYLLGWLAYGSGSYLVMRTFIPAVTLGPTYSPFLTCLWLVSLFVVTWLIGYLSVITPMGLGVREGAVVATLGPIISTSLASFVALATRLWLIVTEVSLLAIIGLTTLITHWSAKKMSLRQWWRDHWVEATLAIAMIAFLTYFTTYTFLRHTHFISSRFDLGIMDQVVWNTANGRWFELTQPDGTATISRFSIHADIFLVLLAPLYWVVSSPYTLLLVQTIILTLGALPLYWLGREVLKNKPLSLLIALAYLLFPPLQRALIFDFHAVTLTSSFLLFAFYFLYKQRYGWFTVFALLTLSAKETMAFSIIMLGLYAIIAQKNWRVGLTTIGLSSLWFYLLLWQIMPNARSDGSTHFALHYYSQFGDSPGEVIRTIILKPWTWFSQLWTQDQLGYVAYFVFPTAFLALLSPLILLTLPELAINMLSNNWAMHTFYFQYTSGITPFVFIAFIFGVKKALHLFKTSPQALGLIIIAATLITNWFWSPLPGMRWADTAAFSHSFPGETYLRHLSRTIPETASVSTTTNIGPHFSQRQSIYPFPLGVGEADYILVEEGDDFEIKPIDEISAAIRALEHDTRYERMYQENRVQAFRKR